MTGVLLVGAGAVGARTARQLVDTTGIERVYVADQRAARARDVAAAMGPRAEAVSWSPGEPLPDGVRAIAAAVPAELEQPVALSAVQAGVPFAGAGDDAEGASELVELRTPAESAGVTVAVGCGLAPGLADVLARHAVDGLESVDEINVARSGVAGDACSIAYKRSRRERAAEWRDGEWVEIKRRTGHELVWFPDPVGACECELVATGVAMLADAFPGIDRVSVKVGDPTEGRRSPSWLRRRDEEGTWGAVRVEVWGRRDGGRVPVVYGAIERTAVASGTVLGVTAAALAGAVPDALEARPGVHGLAALARPVPFLAELARRGVKAAVFEGVPVA